MNVVVPMAGLGSRFATAGYTLPKPLIPVRGEAMYRWAVSSLDLTQASRLVFVLRESEHRAALEADIRDTYRAHEPRVVTLPRLTRGQAETVYLAAAELDLDRPILIHNSDTAFTSDASAWAFGDDDGVLHTFDSTEKRWSFARLGSDGLVDRVTEKDPISNHASTGTYYFRDTRDLFARLARAVDHHLGAEELYIAPLYNDLIARGRRVTLRPVTRNLCFGTPQDLAETNRILDRIDVTRETLIAGARGG